MAVTKDPEAVIRDQINGNFGWVSGTNLFRGPIVATYGDAPSPPAKAVFVAYTGGPESFDLEAGGGPGRAEYRADVQITVRGDPATYNTTRTDALAIFNLLQDNYQTGFVEQRCQTSSPFYVAMDERQCPIFVMNFTLWWCEG